MSIEVLARVEPDAIDADLLDGVRLTPALVSSERRSQEYDGGLLVGYCYNGEAVDGQITLTRNR